MLASVSFTADFVNVLSNMFDFHSFQFYHTNIAPVTLCLNSLSLCDVFRN